VARPSQIRSSPSRLEDRRAVRVGWDVHQLSVRLAAVRAGEELAEQSLADDHDVVITALGGWPGVRVGGADRVRA
jgi:hypothetical protein